MKPLVSYYGGKQRMASRIVPLLPRHTVYVEPFAGGAAMFFAKPWPPVTNSNHYREVLNDLDGRLINLYRVAQDPIIFERFIRLVSVPHSRQVYKSAKGADDESIDAAEAAAAYWVNAQCSFASQINSGWRTAVFGRNDASCQLERVASLPQYLDRMMGVYVEQDDALSVIRRWDSPQTLFCCDPPYVGTDQCYRHKIDSKYLGELCDTLNAAKGSFALSGYPHEIPDSYNWKRHDFAAHCFASGKGKVRDSGEYSAEERRRTECLWVVDRSDDARSEVHAIWEQWAGNGFRWGGDHRTYGGQIGLFEK